MSCKFIANRHDRSCNNEILSTSSPFCKRHINTLQAQSYSYYEKEEGVKGDRDRETKRYKKVQIVQNKFGNFEDKDTKIVFNGKARKAEGYQNQNT